MLSTETFLLLLGCVQRGTGASSFLLVRTSCPASLFFQLPLACPAQVLRQWLLQSVLCSQQLILPSPPTHNHLGMLWAPGQCLGCLTFLCPSAPEKDLWAGVQQRDPHPPSSPCSFLTIHSSVGLVPAMNSGHSTDVAHQKSPCPAPISYRTLVTKPDAQGASGTDGVILSRRLCSLHRLLGVEMLVLEAHISEDRAIR